MAGYDKATQEHIRELLQAVEVARDSLPYTEEFDKLKTDFYDRTFKKLSDSELWLAILSVSKKGGIKGKKKTQSPLISDDFKESLLKMLPVPIGQIDNLPYTEKLEKFTCRFNAVTQAKLSIRDVWLILLTLRK
ncbi:MAG: hypothetical protein JXM70_27475 [Pirellulales bacterium]|nr:hypothetical protein [Pirellulales bacterium]